MLLTAVQAKQCGRDHMGVQDAHKRHPPRGQLLDDLREGDHVQTQAAILLRNDRAEQAEGGHLVDQLVGIDVVVVEGGCSGHHVLLDEAPNSRHQFGGGGGIDSRHRPRGY